MKKILAMAMIINLTLLSYSQKNNFISLNYVGNYGSAPLGISTFIKPEKTPIGFYFEFKISTGYFDNRIMAPGEIPPDQLKNVEFDYIITNFGIFNPINEHLGIYTGLGISNNTRYYPYNPRYYNDVWILIQGFRPRLNFNFGICFIDKKIVYQIGTDTNPFGINFGIGIKLNGVKFTD